MEFLGMRIGVVDVGVRSDRGEELAAVLGEDQVAGPVAAAAQASAAGQVGQVFCSAAGLEIAVLIGEAHDAVGVADVDVLRIRARGIESDAEWLVQAVGERRSLLRLAVGRDAAKDSDFSGCAFGEKEVAVGSDAEQAGIVETGGVKLDFEAFGRDGPRVCGAGDHAGAVVDGLVRGRCGQIGDGDMAADAGRLVRCVGKRALAGQNWR